MSRNIEGIYLPDERPETQLMKDLKEVNLPYFIKYCKFIIENQKPKDIIFSGIHEFACDVREKLNVIEGGEIKLKLSDSKIARHINNYSFILITKTQGPNTYRIDYDKLKQFMIDNKYIDDPNFKNKDQYLFRNLIP